MKSVVSCKLFRNGVDCWDARRGSNVIFSRANAMQTVIEILSRNTEDSLTLKELISTERAAHIVSFTEVVFGNSVSKGDLKIWFGHLNCFFERVMSTVDLK